jgi:hypothetical protein
VSGAFDLSGLPDYVAGSDAWYRRMGSRDRQLDQLLDLKRQAWDALPDVGDCDPALLARFVALCDACRIFGVN